MKNLKVTILQTVRTWFGDQIQAVALKHDLDGPDISRVRLLRYSRMLVKEFKTRVLVASKQRILSIPHGLEDALCRRAARELIAIRRIRADHEAGRLSTEAMQHYGSATRFEAQ